MLEWLIGAQRSSDWQDLDPETKSMIDEPPDTPAHLFAVRAFKTALFGTPAPDRWDVPKLDQQQPTGQLPTKQIELPVASTKALPSTNGMSPTEGRARQPDPLASPTKGILLTPGTGAARRKTVTFQQLQSLESLTYRNAEDQQRITLQAGIASAEPIQPGTDLRRSLFKGRLQDPLTAGPPDSQEPKPSLEVAPEHGQTTSNEIDDTTGDVTIDLKSPRSKSGQHWKREYQREHDNSKSEMRKLIQYSQITKSYAAKRDGDAIDLAEKLKKAEIRMKEMEKRVSDLASELLNAQSHGENQADALGELAAQTAKALRYKQKAERYRHALQSQDPVTSDEELRPDNGPASTNVLSFQSRELASLREEVSSLHSAAEQAASQAGKLERENKALKQTILRVKEEMKKYETRHHAREESRKRKDERHMAQRKTLREQVTTCKAENLELRLSRAQERSQMEEEILQLKSRLKVLEITGARQEQRSEEYSTAQSRGNVYGKDMGKDLAAALRDITEAHMTQPRTRNEQHIQALQEPFTSQARNQGSVQVPLDNIESLDSSTTKHCSQPVGAVRSAEERNTSWKVGNLSATNTVSEHKRMLSPLTQNIVHVPQPRTEENLYSPTKDRLTSAHLPLRRLGPLTTSRTSSMARGTPLPPERAAAAKRRLELRRAERNRSSEEGKENIAPAA